MNKEVKGKPPVNDGNHGFVTEYTHYRTRKRMRARDYGYKAWPFGPGGKKR
jgi:hypothetical protein